MSSSIKQTFGQSTSATKHKRPAPFSIRLSAEERAWLERKAGSRPLGRYIRAKLLGDDQTPRKAGRAPTIDYALLGQMLGMLGKTEQVSCLFLLLAAAKNERVAIGEAERQALDEACADIREMRALLIRALGLRSEMES
jgi:hypothetical protein